MFVNPRWPSRHFGLLVLFSFRHTDTDTTRPTSVPLTKEEKNSNSASYTDTQTAKLNTNAIIMLLILIINAFFCSGLKETMLEVVRINSVMLIVYVYEWYICIGCWFFRLSFFQIPCESGTKKFAYSGMAFNHLIALIVRNIVQGLQRVCHLPSLGETEPLKVSKSHPY